MGFFQIAVVPVSKGAVSFGQSIFHFLVNLRIRRDCTTQKGEVVDNFQSLTCLYIRICLQIIIEDCGLHSYVILVTDKTGINSGTRKQNTVKTNAISYSFMP